MSKSFNLDKVELKNSTKVFLWSFGSALVVLLINIVANLDVPTEYLPLVPIVNTILYALKEYLTNNQ